MSTADRAWWATARAARDRLEASLIHDPNVRMISIGLDPQGQSKLPVLLVHVRDIGAASSVPTEIDGITVRVVYGDYQPEQGEP
ncbi:MAG TPA: hypothetical protein VKE41_15505 [Roseiflexaceae bacterium]|nr:hypothetical protein [Roseiflexaceae bacterium]